MVNCKNVDLEFIYKLIINNFQRKKFQSVERDAISRMRYSQLFDTKVSWILAQAYWSHDPLKPNPLEHILTDTTSRESVSNVTTAKEL